MVATGLYFPNGVGLAPDESALLVAETTTHRLVRVALPSGELTELADLPAYPDNLSTVGDGTYWVALPSPRLAIAERLLPHPTIPTRSPSSRRRGPRCGGALTRRAYRRAGGRLCSRGSSRVDDSGHGRAQLRWCRCRRSVRGQRLGKAEEK